MESFGETFEFSHLKPIRDLIYEHIRRMIFSGELKDGERLVEKDLAERLKVSRTPVREALRKLETEGLVVHLPRKGVVVKGFSREDVIEIYSIREALEALAITYTVKNITGAELEKLRECLELMRRHTEVDDTENLFRASQEFNDILIKSCRMPRLIDLISTYQEYLARFRMVTMKSRERKLSALKEHEEIFKAVAERDVERAEKLVRNHLRKALETYLKTFD
ncbi:GntR family transcriptional regulator [Thermosediminibacter litoriperuensis]|uniref:Transcriptional regulator, GntR family n=1 Tax=Thermosediminibacter litoriperuensis TaxID=291989 RepID=A0A5S5AUX1_9FIRM|nr:GntR family transcriptional regulator [Thermosediminibacter litoriperuensis]TYP55413.1 transcriptional regulator, GntR family [Thermosediminibacter litoriperuensis]